MSFVNHEQMRASNPFDSVWVSASAGTGKTKVLTDRVLRLLLQATKPERLLCLTFTKAAAAEMENRVNSCLKNWAVCSDEALIQNIEELTQETPDNALLLRARSLFSKVLETPGGMKIMTIHSFCQSLLKRFPLEAEVPPHFEVLDDLVSKTMLDDILEDVLSAPDPKIHDCLKFLTRFISTNSLIELFKRILNESASLTHLMERYPGSIETLFFELSKYFNIEKYHSEKQIINDFCSIEEWPFEQKKYLTKDGAILKAKREDDRAFLAYETNQKLKQFYIVEATKNLLTVALRVLNKYNALKNQNAQLDYTDLIEKTDALLSKSSMTPWVLYKLDGGIDHILVDEAQDTNRPQWSIIKALAEEFFSGEGRSENLRTLFVVGDKKQSIFSFQGADPVAFEQMRSYFEQRILASENNFENIPLNYSFRSTEPVLRLVNYLLNNEQAKTGILFDKEEAYHLANRSQEAGYVEIWPLELPEKNDEPDPWSPPIERKENSSAMKRLICKMADKIKNMIGKELLPSKGRLIEPSDILILLQKRGKMMSEIVRALRERHVPVAGVDRLILTDYLAIQDLLALTEFVLQPYNDLNLANLVKSPLIGLKEADLYEICYNRDSLSVWERLQKKYPSQVDELKSIMNLADKVPPFEFYSTILGAFHARKNFIARFGEEVNDILDEFLNLCVKFEQTNTPSLQLFLNWFLKHEIEIKRDLNNSETNAVRIMTVHGSKGLQGNIVFLPDTRNSKEKAKSGGEFVWTKNALPFWIPSSAMRPAALDALFEERDDLLAEERHRLLYVALTRASDQLYICGYDKKQKPADDNWYDLILHSLPQTIQPNKESILSWGSEQVAAAQTKKRLKMENDYNEIPLWAKTIPMPEAPLQKPLIQFQEEDEQISSNESIFDSERQQALKRGVFLHKLLQFLPTIPLEKREEYAKKMCPPDITLPNNLLQIFEKPELQELFGPHSLAEVPVVGTLENQQVSGQIDRLVVLPNEVKIIDFKTNRFVPEKVPKAYKKQLDTYKDLLKTIFPDKLVKSYILWTQTLHFEEV